jgi:hypothetical protein
MTDQFSVEFIRFLEKTGRASAKKFLVCVELLVDLESRHESDAVVIGLGGFLSGHIPDGFACPGIVLPGVSLLLHLLRKNEWF